MRGEMGFRARTRGIGTDGKTKARQQGRAFEECLFPSAHFASFAIA
jgi:hypothetical protein